MSVIELQYSNRIFYLALPIPVIKKVAGLLSKHCSAKVSHLCLCRCATMQPSKRVGIWSCLLSLSAAV